jgi:hypothetical protein
MENVDSNNPESTLRSITQYRDTRNTFSRHTSILRRPFLDAGDAEPHAKIPYLGDLQVPILTPSRIVES